MSEEGHTEVPVPPRFKTEHEEDRGDFFRARIPMRFEGQITAFQLQERRPSRDNMVIVLIEEALAARSVAREKSLFKGAPKWKKRINADLKKQQKQKKPTT